VTVETDRNLSFQRGHPGSRQPQSSSTTRRSCALPSEMGSRPPLLGHPHPTSAGAFGAGGVGRLFTPKRAALVRLRNIGAPPVHLLYRHTDRQPASCFTSEAPVLHTRLGQDGGWTGPMLPARQPFESAHHESRRQDKSPSIALSVQRAEGGPLWTTPERPLLSLCHGSIRGYHKSVRSCVVVCHRAAGELRGTVDFRRRASRLRTG
jgi:hypothetical protein